MNTLVSIFFLGLCVTYVHSQQVTAKCGKVSGTTSQSRGGKTFYSFQGIPYAEPPTGNLRFKPSVEKTDWTTVFDASQPSKMCYQPRPEYQSMMTEDCLVLNVYTPNLSSKAKKSVMVFIHGGSLVSGTGSSAFFGPEYLIDRDIVLVTINYRLGAFGFLSTGTYHAPGNNGFKDQVLALKWVKRNIKYFGGDPDSVALVGHGSGARSVSLHMVSRSSRLFFHRAIAMSGSAAGQWRYSSNQLALARKYSKFFNCPSDQPADILTCLSTVAPMDLANAINNFKQFGDHPLFEFQPVIEPDFGQTRFLTENPTTAYVNDRFHRVPMMIGSTRDEFVQAAYNILNNDTLRSQLDDSWSTYAPICFMYSFESTSRRNAISAYLRENYINNGPLTLEFNLDELGSLFSDAVLGFGANRLAHMINNRVPVYFYKNSYVGSSSHFYYPGSEVYGVSHGDDLQYLFSLRYFTTAPSSSDIDTIERMTRLWSNFVKGGNPNKYDDQYLSSVRWEPLDSRNENYLSINTELTSESNLFQTRARVWDKQFKLPCRDDYNDDKEKARIEDFSGAYFETPEDEMPQE